MRNYVRRTPRHPFGHRLQATQAVSRPRVRDITWAAGFYEGEGTCNYSTNSEHTVISQVEREPLEMMLRLFGGSIYVIPVHGASKASFRWAVHGPRARGVLLTLYTLLSAKRRAQIRAVLARGRD